MHIVGVGIVNRETLVLTTKSLVPKGAVIAARGGNPIVFGGVGGLVITLVVGTTLTFEHGEDLLKFVGGVVRKVVISLLLLVGDWQTFELSNSLFPSTATED